MRNCLNCKWYVAGEIYKSNEIRKYCACQFSRELKYPRLHIFCKQWNNQKWKSIGSKYSYILNAGYDLIDRM